MGTPGRGWTGTEYLGGKGHLQLAFPRLMLALPNFFMCLGSDGDPARVLPQLAARVVGLGVRPQRGQRLGCLCLFGVARVQYLLAPHLTPAAAPSPRRWGGCSCGQLLGSAREGSGAREPWDAIPGRREQHQGRIILVTEKESLCLL